MIAHFAILFFLPLILSAYSLEQRKNWEEVKNVCLLAAGGKALLFHFLDVPLYLKSH